MREDLEYGCKKERFRLRLEDLCYAWALLEGEEKGNLGNIELEVLKLAEKFSQKIVP